MWLVKTFVLPIMISLLDAVIPASSIASTATPDPLGKTEYAFFNSRGLQEISDRTPSAVYPRIILDGEINKEFHITGWVQYYTSTCKVKSTGTWKTIVAPKRGKLRFGIKSFRMPNGVCAGKIFPFGTAFYTWTTQNPTEKSDPFRIQWTNGEGFFADHPVLVNYVPQLLIKRPSVIIATARGKPTGGSNTVANPKLIGGVGNVRIRARGQNTTNPRTYDLLPPVNTSGRPQPGGMSELAFWYSKGTMKVTQSAKATSFGMSCYYTPTEDTWGTAPEDCSSIRYKGVLYEGIYTSEETKAWGLTGDRCKAFLIDLWLQGSARAADGSLLKADKGLFTRIKRLPAGTKNTGADGSEVVANRTVARDRGWDKIIPIKGVNVELDRFGTVLANDIGARSDIRGYRLDLYRGEGSTVCTGFTNPMVMGACKTDLAKCPTMKDVGP